MNRPWIWNGSKLGFIRGSVYWIDRTVQGKRYQLSTRCRTPEAAYREYQRFEELGAEKYRTQVEADAAASHTWDRLVAEYLVWMKNIKNTSDKHRAATAKRLADWGAFKGFTNPNSFAKADVEAFVAALRAGGITAVHRVNYVTRELVKVPSRPGQPTVNRYLASLKGFMRWCRDNEYTANNADRRVMMAKEKRNVRPPQAVEKNGGLRSLANSKSVGAVRRKSCSARA